MNMIGEHIHILKVLYGCLKYCYVLNIVITASSVDVKDISAFNLLYNCNNLSYRSRSQDFFCNQKAQSGRSINLFTGTESKIRNNIASFRINCFCFSDLINLSRWHCWGARGALDNIWQRDREVPSSSPRWADMLCVCRLSVLLVVKICVLWIA